MSISPAVQEQLALNPNQYLELPLLLQRYETVALACIQNGVRSAQVIETIMGQNCPSLRKNVHAWKLLIDSAIQPRLFYWADASLITSDAALMKRAIRNCGPRVFEFVTVQDQALKQELALLTLQCMAGDRIDFEDMKEKFVREVEIILKSVFDRVPPLSANVDAWELVVDIMTNHVLCDYYDVSIEAIWAMAAPNIRDNTKIMKRSCMDSSGDHFEYASERLRRDMDLIRDIIQNQREENDFLFHVPVDVLVDHPSLVVDFLEHEGNTGTVMDVLPLELWSNHDIVEIYLRKGGPPHDGMQEDAGQDWDYCLALVEGANISRRQPLPVWISDHLQNDLSFLLEAAKRNKWILRYVSDDIKRDPFELLLVTAACHGVQPLRTFQMMSHERAGNMDYIQIDVVNFAKGVTELLSLRENFKIFLCGIHIDRPECLLMTLNLGSDSLIVECIAEFVGVPHGEKLKHLGLAMPVAEELCRDPEGRGFFASMGREYYLGAETSYNVI